MDVLYELKEFYNNFTGKKGVVGYSMKSKPIYFFGVEKTNFPTVIVQYAIHGREYITTYLALKQMDDFYKRGRYGRIFFIPAVNPDGIELCINGKNLWKANARGVDLNVNFDAQWGQGEFNISTANSENFIGDFPFSESETSALKTFTLSVRPNFTISYHAKGEEIYYEFLGGDKERDYKIAKVVSDSTGYPLKSVKGSCGGYKDWCIQKLGIPAVTVEVGDDRLFHPISKRHLTEIYKKNKRVLFDVTDYLWRTNGN